MCITLDGLPIYDTFERWLKFRIRLYIMIYLYIGSEDLLIVISSITEQVKWKENYRKFKSDLIYYFCVDYIDHTTDIIC